MRLPVSLLAAYALPAIPLAALTLPLYIIVPTFYSETLGLSLAAVGAALLVVRLFDAFNDPVIGWLADRWRPAFGRRRAVTLLSLPICALGALMVFWPPLDVGVTYLVFWAAILSIGYTAAVLPLSAWGAELAGDYSERSRVTGFREGFTLIGTLVAIALPFAIGIDDADGLHGLAVLGVAVAVLVLLFGALAVWRVPEPREYSTARLTLRSGLVAMKRNRPFLRLVTAFLVNGLANGIPATLFLYFVSDALGRPDMRGPLLFLYFLSGIAGVPLALAVARRIGKHRAWCVAMLATCAVFGFVPLLGAGDVVPFAIICVLTGLTLGFDLALPAAIQADVIDADTAVSGEQRSGAYFAAWSLATKSALALAVGIAFPLLGAFGFEPGSTANDAGALVALAITYSWLPIALKLTAIAMMWNFPLDETAQRALRRTIEQGTAVRAS
jgi:glycoside/pentoside/hexuronide:cation symporter, GPH family